eukprot:scaffold680738_cov45-Prasinocladus_malaysianus.AAC.2
MLLILPIRCNAVANARLRNGTALLLGLVLVLVLLTVSQTSKRKALAVCQNRQDDFDQSAEVLLFSAT